MVNQRTSIRAYVQHWMSEFCFAWHGQRALDQLCLEPVIPCAMILCCDDGLECADLDEDVLRFSLECRCGVRERWSNDTLEQIWTDDVKECILHFVHREERPLAIVGYRSTHALEAFTALHAGTVLNLTPPVRLKDYFDSKLVLREALSQLELECAPGWETTLGRVDYDRVTAQIGRPFVVQLPVGSSGGGTHLVTEAADLDEIDAAVGDSEQDVVVLKYFPTSSVNINACVYHHEGEPVVILSPPSLQLLGIEHCTTRPFAYCGNDYTALATKFDRASLERVFAATERIGAWMATKGWRGIFGLDILVTEEHIYIIDLNPRFQGSTQLLTEAQHDRGDIPLTFFHLAEFVGTDLPRAMLEAANERARTPLAGAQLIFSNQLPKDGIVDCQLPYGRWAMTKDGNGSVRHVGLGRSVSHCAHNSKNEFILTCGMPFRGKTIRSGAPLCKLQTWDRMAIQTNKLTPAWSEVAETVYTKFDIRPLGQ